MTTALLYHRSAPWDLLFAFVAAITIEAGAIWIAAFQKAEEIPIETGLFQQQPVEAIVTELPPEPTPPPEEELPPPPPPPPAEPSEFVIEEPAPPPRPVTATRTRPRIAASRRSGVPAGPVNLVSAQANMLSSPHPSYPYEARRLRETGSGKFLLEFNDNGNVVDVRVARSTGSGILDEASMSTFRRWRCRPGIYKRVYVPITFTLEGAQL